MYRVNIVYRLPLTMKLMIIYYRRIERFEKLIYIPYRFYLQEIGNAYQNLRMKEEEEEDIFFHRYRTNPAFGYRIPEGI